MCILQEGFRHDEATNQSDDGESDDDESDGDEEEHYCKNIWLTAEERDVHLDMCTEK